MKPTPLEPKAEEHDLGGERARGQLRQQEHGELQGQEDGRRHEEPKRTGRGVPEGPQGCTTRELVGLAKTWKV